MLAPKRKSFAIEVKNLNKKHRINEKFIKKITLDIIKILEKPRNIDLEVIFLSNAAIGALNKRYKHKDSPTDVLSFNLDGLGEVIISSDMALKNAVFFGTTFEKEVVLYVIHGILHLFGYEDETLKAKKRMREKEDAVMERLCMKENLSKVLTRR
jgi:probable rRNA maturation factor